ncbi:MAG: class I tRNA ligase family protein, partial [Tissierellaceae bacterium]
HPFMPFITEEIWQHLPGNDSPLILSSWPEYKNELDFPDSEGAIEFIKTAIKSIRNARAEMNIAQSKKSNQIFVTDDEKIKSIIAKGERYFLNLASADEIEFSENKEGMGEDNISVVLDRCEVYLPLKELIDFEKEIDRLEKEKEKLEVEIKRVNGKLSNDGFVKKAPEKVVLEERKKKDKYEEMLEKVLERLEGLKSNR